MHTLVGLGAAALTLAPYPAYLDSVRRCDARPAPGSWTSWAFAAAIVLTSQVLGDAGWSMALTVAQFVGIIAVLRTTVRVIPWRPSALDLWCIALSCIGATLAVLVGQPALAVGGSIAANIVATLPTYRSVWRDPGAERASLWLVCSLAGALSALAAPRLGLVECGYGVYLFVGNGVIAVLCTRRSVTATGRRSSSSVSLDAPDVQRVLDDEDDLCGSAPWTRGRHFT